jgi:hypothetical protein
MTGLVAYTGIGPVPHLLRRHTQPGTMDAARSPMVRVPPSATRAKPASTNALETTK